MTLAKLLIDATAQRPLSGHSVIVLDEAGAVGLDDMGKTFDLAISTAARGDALRILEQYSSYRFSELTTIRRQKPPPSVRSLNLPPPNRPTRRLPNSWNLAR